ncbi:putative membrane protein [Photobacterium profundum SS9]|uniref:Membrane protein n=1 Tax=Photobacterium profundum (strain SS9) TaxID=298386 RepID=Q6LGI4_PHOPR|nr:putative membrane protein [Photobacterium profundum SS9]
MSFALGISTFYQKDDRKLKMVMLIFNLNHLLHFLLLGSMVSALSALLSAVRTATALYVSSKVVAAAFITISLVSGIWLSDTIWDLWPILGTIIGTYSVFVLKGIQMRIGFLVGATCWLINNILVGSIGGTLLEVTVICVNVITVSRLLRDQRQQLATSK